MLSDFIDWAEYRGSQQRETIVLATTYSKLDFSVYAGLVVVFACGNVAQPYARFIFKLHFLLLFFVRIGAQLRRLASIEFAMRFPLA